MKFFCIHSQEICNSMIHVASSMDYKLILKLIFAFTIFCSSNSKDLPGGCTNIGGFVPPKVIKIVSKGVLYSPGFEENTVYPANVRCTYELSTHSNSHVRLHFNALDIHPTDQCSGDFLKIYDLGNAGKGLLVSILCGNQTPFDYVSKSYALKLVLQTDGFSGGRGFNITYSHQATSSVCSFGEIKCRNRNCVDMSVLCDGNDDCGDGTDEEKCPGNVLPTTECGKPEIDHVTFADLDRIVGGRNAVHGSWPWMADLQQRGIEPNAHICGGALINAQWVVSAAHCFGHSSLRAPRGWRIHLGNYHKYEKDSSEQIRYAKDIVIYGKFPEEFEKDGKYDLVHDVALVKLNAPVKFTKYVKPVCLPNPDIKLNTTSKCYATGWGATRGTGGTDVLKQAYHPVQEDASCSRLVGRKFVPRTMICAGSMDALNGVCHGDSGGPFVCETKRGQWSLFGVTSYVTDTNKVLGLCGLQKRPSVFNRISIKSDWIRQMVNMYS